MRGPLTIVAGIVGVVGSYAIAIPVAASNPDAALLGFLVGLAAFFRLVAVVGAVTTVVGFVNRVVDRRQAGGR